MKPKFSSESMEKLRTAIVDNDLAQVKELIEYGKVGITNMECALAVKRNNLDILKYFLETSQDAITVLSYGLYEAVYCNNLEAIKMIVQYFRNNKKQFPNQDLDSIINRTINYVTELGLEDYFSSTKTMEITNYILNCYYN